MFDHKNVRHLTKPQNIAKAKNSQRLSCRGLLLNKEGLMSHTSTHHSFSVELAMEYGVEKAILIHHFQHWIKFNRRKNSPKHFKDKRWWSFQTREDIEAYLPYLDSQKIRYHMDALCEDCGVFIKGNYNKSRFDKTTWYAFRDEERFLGEEVSNNSYESGKPPSTADNRNGCADNRKPIPDPNSDTKTTEINPKREEAPPFFSLIFDSVKMQQEEYSSLVEKHGKEVIDEYIENLNNYSKTHPKKFKEYGSHSAVITTWIRRDKQKGNTDFPIHNSEENKQLAQNVVDKFPAEVKKTHIQLKETAILFEYGREYDLISFRDIEFREKLMCRLAMMHLNPGEM